MRQVTVCASGRGPGRSWIPLCLLAASLSLNVWLAVRLRASSGGGGPLPTGPQVGFNLQGLDGTSPAGRPVHLLTHGIGLPTVVYVFSPSCVWCERNLRNIQAVVRARGVRFRFVGVSLSSAGIGPYLSNHQLDMPIIAQLEPATISRLRLGATPETIVVGSDGRVEANWLGAYVGDTQAAVEKFFGLRLPGLTVADGGS